jgi:AbrB family looped-hinge helix DNA binding protein
MELAKIGKKGQLTIPRSVLRKAGIAVDSRVIVEATAGGSIVIRPAAVYPIETYSDERVREFEETNRIPAAIGRRVQEFLRKSTKKC